MLALSAASVSSRSLGGEIVRPPDNSRKPRMQMHARAGIMSTATTGSSPQAVWSTRGYDPRKRGRFA